MYKRQVFVTAQSPIGGVDTAIMDVVRNMMLKRMLVFSGAGKNTTNKFQLGAVGIVETMNKDAEQFQVFGENIAEKVISLIAKQ